MSTISAITITWNSAVSIAGLLESVLSEKTITDVVVIDNASTDGTKELIRERFPSVRLIENAGNRGFAGAANQGIAATTGEYILLVNPDITFGPDFLAPLVHALVGDRNAGSASPKLVRPGGAVIDSAGMAMHRNRKAKDRGREEKDSGQYDTPCRVFGACGAAALFRRFMFEDVAVGGEFFDETFFSYKEDVDLAWRANLMGWKALYVPASVAVHLRGWKESGRKGIPRFIRRHSHKNRYLTIIKNDDPVNILLHLPHILFYEAKLFIYALLVEPFLFLSFKDIFIFLEEALEKRRETMRRRRMWPREIRRMFGPTL